MGTKGSKGLIRAVLILLEILTWRCALMTVSVDGWLWTNNDYRLVGYLDCKWHSHRNTLLQTWVYGHLSYNVCCIIHTESQNEFNIIWNNKVQRIQPWSRWHIPERFNKNILTLFSLGVALPTTCITMYTLFKSRLYTELLCKLRGLYQRDAKRCFTLQRVLPVCIKI